VQISTNFKPHSGQDRSNSSLGGTSSWPMPLSFTLHAPVAMRPTCHDSDWSHCTGYSPNPACFSSRHSPMWNIIMHILTRRRLNAGLACSRSRRTAALILAASARWILRKNSLTVLPVPRVFTNMSVSPSVVRRALYSLPLPSQVSLYPQTCRRRSPTADSYTGWLRQP
jgi:hypothetical protein